MEKKLVPYSVYLPEELFIKIKALAKERKASTMIRDAITVMINGNDSFKGGYNKGIRDAAKVVFDCKEAQMVAVNGRDIGAVLSDQILALENPNDGS
jgi:hypothetical protein